VTNRPSLSGQMEPAQQPSGTRVKKKADRWGPLVSLLKIERVRGILGRPIRIGSDGRASSSSSEHGRGREREPRRGQRLGAHQWGSSATERVQGGGGRSSRPAQVDGGAEELRVHREQEVPWEHGLLWRARCGE
jgi:hypothetical protein